MSLKIINLSVEAGGKNILRGLNMEITSGKIHAIMGPNGSGKSTLANAIAGNPKYQITKGTIRLGEKAVSKLSADKIARAGILLAFQAPESVPGVSVANLLYLALNKNNRGKKKIGGNTASDSIKTEAKKLRLSEHFINRPLNENFSGGEKKKMEILQLAALKPKFAILDEIDSGLDVDALKLVAKRVIALKNKGAGILIITHYNRILNFLNPNFVHVLQNGKIVKSGKFQLASEIEKNGYMPFRKES